MVHFRGYGNRKVAAYGSWLDGQRICCSNDLPKCLNCIRPLENNEDYRTRSHMVDQFLKERLSLMHAIERLRLLMRNLVQSQLFEREPFPFQPRQDLAHEAVLDCVRFEKREGSLLRAFG